MKTKKGRGIVMKEDLTIGRQKIVIETSEKYDFKNGWTYNGEIYAKIDTVEKIIYIINRSSCGTLICYMNFLIL